MKETFTWGGREKNKRWAQRFPTKKKEQQTREPQAVYERDGPNNMELRGSQMRNRQFFLSGRK